jgi:transcriptional regulator with XRE-family HTH domain
MKVSNKPFRQALEDLFIENPMLSLNEVARRGSLDPAYVWRLRRGEKLNPSMDIIKRIAYAFDVEPHYFVEYRAEILAEVARKWPELLEKGLSPEKSLKLLQLEERCKKDVKVAKLHHVFRWLIANEAGYPLIDEVHELLLYQRHDIFKRADRESRTRIKGINKQEDHKPSRGIDFAITGGSYVSFDSLNLTIRDNNRDKFLSPILIQDEGTRKLIFAPFLESVDYGGEFDLTVKFKWEGSFPLPTDWLSMNLTRFKKGVRKVEQIFTFADTLSKLEVFIVDTEYFRVRTANQNLAEVKLPEFESLKSFRWHRKPFDYRQIVVFMFSREL